MLFRFCSWLLGSLLLWSSAALLAPTAARAQQPVGPQLTLPQASPHAVILQTLGLTDVTVDYHSPAVRKRPIWGALVPYNQVWRAGANENTLLTFSRPVQLNGQPVAAGQYSLYVFPRADAEWDVILNRVTTHWGSEDYDPNDDVVHVPVLPEKAAFQETLLYWFSQVQPAGGQLNLTWERLTLSLRIDTGVQAQVLAGLADTLARHPADWQLLAQAADYLVQQHLQPELALRYIDESIRLRENYANTWTKARLLASQQDYGTAVLYARKALKLGDKDDDAFKSQLPNMRVTLVEWQAKAY